jgi:hypothetical protein
MTRRRTHYHVYVIELSRDMEVEVAIDLHEAGFGV